MLARACFKGKPGDLGPYATTTLYGHWISIRSHPHLINSLRNWPANIEGENVAWALRWY